MDSGRVVEHILAGPTIPLGVEVLSLSAPIAQALLDCVVGDIVTVELNDGDVEWEVLGIWPPPPPGVR
ncbi:MAG: GreA/GreB family elongation factor [Sandaracinaceae bacterium]|nr:GreA/GreB family elongation factor [Sandaracinaceae bacterium]